MPNRLLATALLILALAAPAHANCAETYIELAAIAPALARGAAALEAGPDGTYFDRLEGDKLYVSQAFELLPPQRKAGLVRDASATLWGAIPQADRERFMGVGQVAHGVKVVDPLGRTLYQHTPCFGSFTTLTEHQRFLAMFSFGEHDETAWRVQTHPLPKGIDMKALRRRFVAAGARGPGFYLGWVPEGGFFEIDLPARAHVRRLAAFWRHAPRGHRYDVRLNDGTLVQTVRR